MLLLDAREGTVLGILWQWLPRSSQNYKTSRTCEELAAELISGIQHYFLIKVEGFVVYICAHHYYVGPVALTPITKQT